MAVRLPAEWMQASDDRILEYLDDEGRANPSTISDEGPFDYHRNTIQNRLRRLTKIGLVQRVGHGLYQITNKGQRYIAGQEDLRGVEKPE